MERIGFIGLGIMGAPMARNLVAAGYEVTTHNRSPRTIDGARSAGSPAEVAAASEVVITMLPDSPDVEAVVAELEPRAGTLFIDMSTIAPATARRLHAELAERGVEALDAPVSGGEAAAIAGELSIMVGGDEAALERARPLFDVLGRSTTYIGPPGSGQVAKAANQVVVALTIQAVAEALLLARRSDVDPARVREALLGGFAQSKILEVHGQRMLDEAFDPGFKARLHRKDLGIALQAGREQGAPLPATALAAELFTALIAHGEGDLDHSALARVYDRLAGAHVPA